MVDIQYSGTTASVATFMVTSFDTLNQPSASFDLWAGSAYVAVVGGSLANITAFYLQGRYLPAGTPTSVNFLASLTGTLQQLSSIITASSGVTAGQFAWYFQFPSGGVAINVTFRIASPQWERNLAVSPPIWPPVGAPAVTTAPMVATPNVFTNPVLIPGVQGQTNLIRNSRCEGATVGVGAAGLMPTYWTISLAAGAKSDVVATGIDVATGFSYIDVRFYGTQTAVGGSLRFEAATFIDCNPSDTFSQSCYMALVGGTMANVTNVGLALYATNTAGTIVLNPPTSGVIIPTASLTPTLQRFFNQAYTLTSLATIANNKGQCCVDRARPGVARCSISRFVSLHRRLNSALHALPSRCRRRDSLDRPTPCCPAMGRSSPILCGSREPKARPTCYSTHAAKARMLALGATPTYWAQTPHGGVFTTCVGIGTDVTTGLPYVDIRLNGTSSSTGYQQRFLNTFQIPFNPNDPFAFSVYLALVGGSTAGNVTFLLYVYSLGPDGIQVGGSVNSGLLTLTATPQRFIFLNTAQPNATVSYMLPLLAVNWNNATAIDCTYRVICPQFEWGYQASAPSLPPPGILRPSDTMLSANAQVFTTPVGIYGQGGITNFINNPNSEGAVVGTIGSGGAWPTSWSINTFLALGIQIVASGVSDPDLGLPYIDVRLFGTPNATGATRIQVSTATSIPTVIGDVWSQSIYVALVGGSATNVANFGQVIYFADVTGGVGTGNTPAATFVPTGTLQRFPVPGRAVVGATTRRAWPAIWISMTINLAVDFTLRIAAPQLENNPVVTPPILPPLGTPAVTTRGLLANPVVGNFATIQGWPTIITANAIRLAYGGATVLGSPTIITATPVPFFAASSSIPASPTIITATPTLRLPASSSIPASPTIITANPVVGNFANINGRATVSANPVPLFAARATITGIQRQTNLIRNPRAEGATIGIVRRGDADLLVTACP